MAASNMGIGALLVSATMMMAMLGMASAATYNVGEPGGAWDTRTNYGDWVASKRFHPNDQIVFKYSPSQHDVLEVNKAAYDSCNTDVAVATLTTGNDVVTLNSTGTRYFICGFPNHCTTTGTGLMKLKIDVVPAADSFSPAPPGGPTANSPPPPSSTATSVKAAAGFGIGAVLLAALVV